VLLSPAQIGFSDFTLTMGALTANGQLIYGANHQLNGEIDADTLALPPIPANFPLPWTYLANIQGRIKIAANSVLLAGNQILGPTSAKITLAPGKFDFALNQAVLAGGKASGAFSATLPAPAAATALPGKTVAAPAITAQFATTGSNAAMLDPPFVFPLNLPSGTISAAIDLTASGYTPAVWLATLAGNASLAGSAGAINGFSLPGLTAALHAPKRHAAKLRAACLSGLTPFKSFSLTGSLSSGIATLTSATLQSPGGSAIATGNIDLPDTGLTLALTLLPAVPASPKLTLTMAGSWSAPRKIAAIKPALTWKPPANKK
jgi:hypothetical protein